MVKLQDRNGDWFASCDGCEQFHHLAEYWESKASNHYLLIDQIMGVIINEKRTQAPKALETISEMICNYIKKIKDEYEQDHP